MKSGPAKKRAARSVQAFHGTLPTDPDPPVLLRVADFLEKRHRRSQIIDHFVSEGVVLSPHPALRATAILLRAIAVPSGAIRIASFRIDAPALFQSDLVLPWDVEVVLIQKTATLAQFQIGKRNLRRVSGRFPGAVTHRMNDKLIKVNALPAHHDLKHTVKLA